MKIFRINGSGSLGFGECRDYKTNPSNKSLSDYIRECASILKSEFGFGSDLILSYNASGGGIETLLTSAVFCKPVVMVDFNYFDPELKETVSKIRERGFVSFISSEEVSEETLNEALSVFLARALPFITDGNWSASVFFRTLSEISLQKKVILYGATRWAEFAVNALRKNNFETLILVDDDKGKQGRSVGGVSVEDPNIVIEKAIENGEKADIISIVGVREIVEKKIRGNLNFTYIGTYAPGVGGADFYERSKDYILKNPDKVETVEKLFADENSRKLFRAVILSRLINQPDLLRSFARPHDEQYFEKGLIRLSDDEVFIDAGAFVGDTVEALLKRVGRVKKTVAFEINETVFKNLEETAKRLGIYENCILIKGGTYSKTGYLSVSGGFMSHLEETGGENIAVYSIDDVISKEKLSSTFIKIDVEGADKETLLGAKNEIVKNKPTVACAVYHLPEDIMEIPLMLKNFNPSYKFYLRQYSGSPVETICYAMEKREYE